MSALLTLYPEITPYKTGMMDTGDGHSIYWEVCGNPKGRAVVVLHGGPGSGCKPWHRQWFNPKKYNIVLFDQRGCGRSTPHASLKNNTTPHLIADMEMLRRTLGIEKWIVFGGSWGSTLALAYADCHAKRVTALVMYGIFLCRNSELRDLYFEGGVASKVFPDAFDPYFSLLPQADRKNPIKGYKKLFQSKNIKSRNKALDLWTRLENRALRLVTSPEQLAVSMSDPAYVLSHSLIENHYFLKEGFIDGARILKTIGKKMKNLPVHIVQGRYDMVCPFKTAWELHKAIPHSHLHIIDDAGHTAREPKTMHTLIKIMNELKT